MLTYHYPLIAREGWMWIALAMFAAGVAYVYVGLASAPLWILVVFLVFLFLESSLPLGP